MKDLPPAPDDALELRPTGTGFPSIHERIVADADRLSKRDGCASIEVSYDDGDNPFARQDCVVCDFGVSDNQYVVTVPLIAQLQAQLNDAMAVIDRLKKENT